MEDNLKIELTNILADIVQMPAEEIRSSETLNNYCDSIGVIEFIMFMEDKYDIEITDEDAEKIKTIDLAEKYLRSRLKSA